MLLIAPHAQRDLLAAQRQALLVIAAAMLPGKECWTSFTSGVSTFK